MHFLSSRAITDDVEQERFVKNGDEVSNIFGGTGRIVDRLATKSITEMYAPVIRQTVWALMPQIVCIRINENWEFGRS